MIWVISVYLWLISAVPQRQLHQLWPRSHAFLLLVECEIASQARQLDSQLSRKEEQTKAAPDRRTPKASLQM